MSIAWDPATMSTEIPTVDRQHRQLIEWLNDLLAAMAEGQGCAEVGAGLDKLATYVDTHFAFEGSAWSSTSARPPRRTWPLTPAS
jgi:hemerythrin-like metal-binding protein